MYGYLEVWK